MHFGSPEQWIDFLESQVPAIINLVIDTWEAMPPPAGNELEDRVSETLCRLLRQSRESRELPFQIHPQLVELDPAAGEDQGRMDIVFLPLLNREDIYFCLECKRLNVRESDGVRPYFAEYVRYGIFRFVRGQYANTVRYGGMLAFVLNGDIPGAMTGVENNIRRMKADLAMNSPCRFETSSVRPADTRIRETRHVRATQSDPFVIHHLFMRGDPNAPLRSVPPPEPKNVKKRKTTTRRKTGNK